MAAKVSVVPHSWAVNQWPQEVYPHHSSRGKYLVRAHRDELIAAGCLVRVGRDLVVLGTGFSAWLSKQSDKVDRFVIAPNRVVTNESVA